MSNYIALTGLDRHVYLLDPADGSSHQLTSHPNVARYNWSPDGRYLACLEHELTPGTSGYTLAVFEIDGTRHQVWTQERTRILWNWSPDGRRLAFTTGEGAEPGQLFLMDLERGNIQQVTSPAAYAVWSQETNDLAFLWNYDHQNIFVMDASGTNRRLLFHDEHCEPFQRHGRFGELLNWSPDGNSFAAHVVRYRYPDPRVKEVYEYFQVVDRQGNLLFRQGWEAFRFSWSPDSRRIACLAPQSWLAEGKKPGQRFNGRVVACVLERDGSALHVLGPTPFQPSNNVLAWSPDSQKIAFAGVANDQDGQNALGIADADGQHLRYYPEAKQNGEEGPPPFSPFWSPDSQQVAYALGALRVVGVDETTPHAFPGDERLAVHYYVDGPPAWQP